MNNCQKDIKAGFDIGWDYYAYDMTLPAYLKGNEFKCVEDGFAEAKKRKISPSKNDRFVKKWLLLRVNAWKRNRYIDASVTPEFIGMIDNELCPITKEKLTHGSMSETDWSVDRINNNAAYALGNIVVVSSRANIAKGDYTHLQILNFAYDTDIKIPLIASSRNPSIAALSREEWARWALICAHAPVEIKEGIARAFHSPCVMTPPKGLFGRSSSFMQMAIAKKSSHRDDGEYKKFLLALNKPNRAEMNTLPLPCVKS